MPTARYSRAVGRRRRFGDCRGAPSAAGVGWEPSGPDDAGRRNQGGAAGRGSDTGETTMSPGGGAERMVARKGHCRSAPRLRAITTPGSARTADRTEHGCRSHYGRRLKQIDSARERVRRRIPPPSFAPGRAVPHLAARSQGGASSLRAITTRPVGSLYRVFSLWAQQRATMSASGRSRFSLLWPESAFQMRSVSAQSLVPPRNVFRRRSMLVLAIRLCDEPPHRDP